MQGCQIDRSGVDDRLRVRDRRALLRAKQRGLVLPVADQRRERGRHGKRDRHDGTRVTEVTPRHSIRPYFDNLGL